MDRLYTAQEVAEYCHRKVETVWYWFRKGVLRYVTLGRTKMVYASELKRFIESGGNNGK